MIANQDFRSHFESEFIVIKCLRLLCKCPFYKVRNFILYFVSLLLTSPSFHYLLEYSAHFCSLYITSSFDLSYLRMFPTILVMWLLLTCYIRFKNVHCSYINLIDSKYSISPLKSFGLSCCHYSQNSAFLTLYQG